jgi:hypothetical protein
LEAKLPKRKNLKQWWAPILEWYANTTKETDHEFYASEKFGNYRKKIKEIKTHIEYNKTKKAF